MKPKRRPETPMESLVRIKNSTEIFIGCTEHDITAKRKRLKVLKAELAETVKKIEELACEESQR